jgi:hypothetical protein
VELHPIPKVRQSNSGNGSMDGGKLDQNGNEAQDQALYKMYYTHYIRVRAVVKPQALKCQVAYLSAPA